MSDPSIFDGWSFDFQQLEVLVKEHLAELARQIKEDYRWLPCSWDDGATEFRVMIGYDDVLSEYLNVKITAPKAKEILLLYWASSTHPDDLRHYLNGVREWKDAMSEAEAEILAKIAEHGLSITNE